MKKRKKRKSYVIRRWKRIWKTFFINLKKAVLIVGIISVIIFIVPSCISVDEMTTAITESDFGQKFIGLHIFDEVIDSFRELESTVEDMLHEFTGTLQALERTLHSKDDEEGVQLSNIPAYGGIPYVVINNHVPYFTKEEITTKSYEYYSELDLLGRCGVTVACIGKELMPTEERGPIGMVKPSGWKLKKYDIVDGKYIYNRCHLIGYQLTGENANEKNLITGTRYMNVDGMLPFENQVAEYVRKTGNHVMYRVTPVFAGNNLVASGVQMEAYSVEDHGAGVCFHVYVYNVQPGIEIDYGTGDNWLEN